MKWQCLLIIYGEHMAENKELLSSFSRQVGGSHYADYAIQPLEFCVKNNIPFLEGNVIKYICRWRKKNGIQDLEKAKHYIEMLIELEKANVGTTDKQMEDLLRFNRAGISVPSRMEFGRYPPEVQSTEPVQFIDPDY